MITGGAWCAACLPTWDGYELGAACRSFGFPAAMQDRTDWYTGNQTDQFDGIMFRVTA